MNRLLAEFIDLYALYQLHREKSVKWHFSQTQSIPALDYNLFYFKPQIPQLSFEPVKHFGQYKTGNFRYKSEVENDECNKYAAGTYFEHDSEVLTVVLVNGWRQGHDRIQAIYLKPFMDNGYSMYFFTLPYHTERQGTDALYNGELMISANIQRTLSSFNQSVTDLRALVSWLKTNKKGKVVLAGISLGGLVVNLTATVEENIDGVISVFAPNELSHTIWNTIPGKYIKQDFEAHAFTYDQLRTCWDMLTASNFGTKIPKEKVFLFSALYDKYIDLKDADKLWEAWGNPERKLYQCGHAGIVLCKKDIANDSLAFIKNNVLEGS